MTADRFGDGHIATLRAHLGECRAADYRQVRRVIVAGVRPIMELLRHFHVVADDEPPVRWPG